MKQVRARGRRTARRRAWLTRTVWVAGPLALIITVAAALGSAITAAPAAISESALVTAETAYEKARIEVRRSTGSVLEEYGISIADAKAGVVEAENHQ